jgi:tRNA (guanine-N7-)-methyltransferase
MLNKNDAKTRKIRSFVRRGGRITPAQKKAFDEGWLTYGITLPEMPLMIADLFETSAQNPKSPKPAAVIQRSAKRDKESPSESPCIVEIGFGMGHSLLAMAEQFPEYHFLGIEMYQPGVGAVLDAMQKRGLNNIRIIREDATEVISRISKETLDGVLIFFPDPWPKKRHHKRRLIQFRFLEELVQKLKAGGYLHIATDWQPYAEHIQSVLIEVSEVSALKAIPEADRLAQKILPRSLTKFEQRGRKLGHEIVEFVYGKQALSLL